MERRDCLICGVNGFTAQKLLELIINTRPELRVGVTCRSEDKLRRTIKELSVKSKNPKGLEEVERYIVGLDNIGKLSKIFEKYKIVINCIGPFATTGLSVVEACIRAGTHYVDCTGEPGFIEESMQVFSEKAKDAGVIVVHACGFDSLPLDIGLNYTVDEIIRKKGQIKSAESYMQLINTRINIGTFKTIITSLDTLRNRKKVKPEKREKKSEIKKVKKMPFFASKIGMYAVIFPGSDSFVLRKTRTLLGNTHPICHCYIAVSSFISMIALIFLGVLVGLVYLLPEPARRAAYDAIDFLSFGKVRSEGPTEQEILCSGFKTRIFAEGTDKDGNAVTYQTLVSGPDPGYITTPITLLVSAELILANSEKAGVHTPGSLFVSTDIVQRLTKEQIMFCSITEKSVKE